MQYQTFKNSKGFTLIELMVVISIVGLLSSVVLASVNVARDKGRTAAGQKFSSSLYHAYGADAVAMYNFDEPSGAILDTANSYTLATSSMNVVRNISDTPNRSISSMSFPGNDVDYVQSNSLTMPFGKTWTWAMWVKVRPGIANPVFFNPGGNGTYLRFVASTGFRLSMNVTPMLRTSCSRLSQCLIDDSTKRNYDTWYHVAATHTDLGGGLGKTVLYVDGKEVKRDDSYDTTLSPSRLYLGKYNGNNLPFDGLLDDVRLYSQSLVASDIQKIYAEGLPTHTLVDNQ